MVYAKKACKCKQIFTDACKQKSLLNAPFFGSWVLVALLFISPLRQLGAGFTRGLLVMDA